MGVASALFPTAQDCAPWEGNYLQSTFLNSDESACGHLLKLVSLKCVVQSFSALNREGPNFLEPV